MVRIHGGCIEDVLQRESVHLDHVCLTLGVCCRGLLGWSVGLGFPEMSMRRSLDGE